MSEPYALEPEPDIPDLPGIAVIRESEDHVLDTLAADIFVQSLECVRQFGDFHLALAAGPMQERLCVRLMIDPAVRRLPWNRAHLWATRDEPDAQGRPTFARIVELLADHAGIPDRQIHIPEPGDAGEYQSRLQQTLAWREKGHDRLDVAVLSLDPDGTIAGLSPTPGEEDEPRLVAPVATAVDAAPGLTMTTRLINATRLIAITATGTGVRPAIGEAARGRIDEQIARLRPLGGSMRWYLDREALPG